MISALLAPGAGQAGERPGAAELRLFPGSAVLTGRVDAAEPCREGEAVIWVSTGSTLLYQSSVVAGSSFEFHVMPGPLEVVVTSQSGCITEQRLAARANQVQELKLLLEPASRKHTHQAVRDPASSGFCAYCQGLAYSNFGGGAPMVLPGMEYAPWWTSYCMYSYTNCLSPGAWMGGGLQGGMYAGNGGGMMGKPNLYVSGPIGTELKIRVETPKGTNLLAAVPKHGTAGWETLTLAPYQLKVEDSRLAYLFYDYRFNPALLQDEEGFCVEADKLMPELTQVLERAGFAANEIRDFREYWQAKMPRADRYCVYPQDNRQLSRVAPLKIEPAPESLIRIGFMVVPQEEGRTPIAFQSRPKRAYAPPPGRQPASEKSVVVREWGVGFLRAR